MIKELIKEKLHASEQISEKKKKEQAASKKEQIWSGTVILAARQYLECQSGVLLIGRGTSWHAGDRYESCIRKKKLPPTCVNGTASVLLQAVVLAPQSINGCYG